MKRLSWMLALAALLLGAPARADKADPSPRVRLVQVMPDTGQALLRDQIRGTYVVVGVGDAIHGYRIAAIASDRITLADGDEVRFVLAASPAPASELMDPYPDKPIATVVAPPHARAEGAAVLVATPAASETARAPAPAAAPVRSEAGIGGPGASGPAVAAAVDGAPAPPADVSTGSSAAPVEPARSAVEPARSAAPVGGIAAPSPAELAAGLGGGAAGPGPAAEAERVREGRGTVAASGGAGAGQEMAGAVVPRSVEVPRSELEAALDDFRALAKELQLSFVEGGVRVDGVRGGSLFHRAGLRQGDVIVRVDERPLRSMGDAAVLYGRLDLVEEFDVEVVRGAQKVVMRCRLLR